MMCASEMVSGRFSPEVVSAIPAHYVSSDFEVRYYLRLTRHRSPHVDGSFRGVCSRSYRRPAALHYQTECPLSLQYTGGRTTAISRTFRHRRMDCTGSRPLPINTITWPMSWVVARWFDGSSVPWWLLAVVRCLRPHQTSACAIPMPLVGLVLVSIHARWRSYSSLSKNNVTRIEFRLIANLRFGLSCKISSKYCLQLQLHTMGNMFKGHLTRVRILGRWAAGWVR